MSNQKQTMQPYQQRVIEEEAELESKLGKLMIFRKSDQCSFLPVEQRELLDMQYYAMELYSHVLGMRIKSFNAP